MTEQVSVDQMPPSERIASESDWPRGLCTILSVQRHSILEIRADGGEAGLGAKDIIAAPALVSSALTGPVAVDCWACGRGLLEPEGNAAQACVTASAVSMLLIDHDDDEKSFIMRSWRSAITMSC